MLAAKSHQEKVLDAREKVENIIEETIEPEPIIKNTTPPESAQPGTPERRRKAEQDLSDSLRSPSNPFEPVRFPSRNYDPEMLLNEVIDIIQE